MPILVIGGHSRSVGKTSVVAGLISALPDFHWTALKITQYGHGVCSANGEACDCATADHSWAVSEEKDRSGESDTSRFLVAGADHSWWVRTEQGRLAEAMPRVRQDSRQRRKCHHRIQQHPALSETRSLSDRARSRNRRLQNFGPDFSRPRRRRIAALSDRTRRSLPGNGVSLKPVANRPMFAIHPPSYVTPDVVEFVRNRLGIS